MNTVVHNKLVKNVDVKLAVYYEGEQELIP
jgi:hypothetical protein